jgi:hypothetical protein
MQIEVPEAETQLSRLLEIVEKGRPSNSRATVSRSPSWRRRQRAGFPFGIARGEPLVAPGDDSWQPMSDKEAEDWIQGR